MSIEGCMDKEDVMCVYYSAMKKDKIMPCAAPLMDLEIFILSEDRKTVSGGCVVTHLKWIDFVSGEPS